MRRSDYEVLQLQTNNMALVWKESRGIAPDSVADKLDDAMLKWMSELTDTLKIWIDKGSTMTEGELILARTNMGAWIEMPSGYTPLQRSNSRSPRGSVD